MVFEWAGYPIFAYGRATRPETGIQQIVQDIIRRLPVRQIQDDFDGAWKNRLWERRLASFMPDAYLQMVFLEQELRAITHKSRRGNRVIDW